MIAKGASWLGWVMAGLTIMGGVIGPFPKRTWTILSVIYVFVLILMLLKWISSNRGKEVIEGKTLAVLEKGHQRLDSLIIESIPKNKELLDMAKWAKSYVKGWALDGEFKGYAMYIYFMHNKIDRHFQLFFHSKNKGENLTKYLPSKSEEIENNERTIVYGEIVSLPKWRKAFKVAVENLGSEFNSADRAYFQAFTQDDALHINITYHIGEIKSPSRHYVFKENNLLLNDKQIANI